VLECIDWALQIYAKDRPQSARQLQDGLMGRGIPRTAEPKPFIDLSKATPRAKQHRESRLGRWIAIIVIAAGIGGAYYFKPDLVTQILEKTNQSIKPYADKLEKLLKR